VHRESGTSVNDSGWEDIPVSMEARCQGINGSPFLHVDFGLRSCGCEHTHSSSSYAPSLNHVNCNSETFFYNWNVAYICM
jgi:hypothetical protein